MDLLNEALEFETRKKRFPTTSDRIMAAREAKSLILGSNEIYKKNISFLQKIDNKCGRNYRNSMN